MEEYCKALQDTKLVSTPAPTHLRHLYDEQAFCEFVNQDMDIRDMDQHLAQYSQGSDVVQALHQIRETLHAGIQKRFPYKGNRAQIGSFYDGSKTGSLNETDCLYVVREANVKVKQAGTGKNHFTISVKGKRIHPRDLNERLIKAMKETLSKMTLQSNRDGMNHMGSSMTWKA